MKVVFSTPGGEKVTIKANKHTLNKISILAGVAAKKLRADGFPARAQEAENYSFGIYAELKAAGFYEE